MCVHTHVCVCVGGGGGVDFTWLRQLCGLGSYLALVLICSIQILSAVVAIIIRENLSSAFADVRTSLVMGVHIAHVRVHARACVCVFVPASGSDVAISWQLYIVVFACVCVCLIAKPFSNTCAP